MRRDPTHVGSLPSCIPAKRVILSEASRSFIARGEVEGPAFLLSDSTRPGKTKPQKPPRMCPFIPLSSHAISGRWKLEAGTSRRTHNRSSLSISRSGGSAFSNSYANPQNNLVPHLRQQPLPVFFIPGVALLQILKYPFEIPMPLQLPPRRILREPGIIFIPQIDRPP